MIQHFNVKPLFENSQIPGWAISFFYKQQRYQAEYEKNGTIHFIGAVPSERVQIEKMVHELMTFHVYE